MRWHAWRMNRADAIRLGRVRHHPRLEVCEADDGVWIRAANPTEDLRTELLALAAPEFSVLDDGQLVERGRRVPSGYLPPSTWLPLAQWMSVEVGVAALGAVVAKVPVRLVRSTKVAQPNVLLATAADWYGYTIAAPQVRLDRLAFALSDVWAAIRGEPLPPIRGARFVERDGVAAPAGWTWEPTISARVLAVAMGIADGDVALVHADGSWDHLAENDFVRATRAAVRQSAAEAGHEQ